MISLKSVLKIAENSLQEAVTFSGDLEDELYNILSSCKEKLLKKGISVGQEVGQGTKGIAFEAGSGKVLKVTLDKTEANSAAVIKGKKLKHVYEVFSVFKFGNTEFFGIVQEELDHLSDPKLNRAIEETAWWWGDYARDEVTADQLIKNLSTTPEISNDQKIAKKIYEIFLGVEELRKLGIKFSDIHPGNIMQRSNGDLVIIDLGYSESAKQGHIEDL